MPRFNTQLRPTLLVVAFLFLACLAPAPALVSDDVASTVDGRFEVVSPEGSTRYIEFHATRRLDGNVSGGTTFQDDPSTRLHSRSNENASEGSQPFFFKADFDCLKIDNKRAVMSGEITQSSTQEYVGRRVLVVAQDNGGAMDPSQTDRVTWGIYYAQQKRWLQSDSERPADEIAPLTWIARDSERLDDEGVASNKEGIIGCQSFPISAFSFISAKQGHGSVRVKP